MNKLKEKGIDRITITFTKEYFAKLNKECIYLGEKIGYVNGCCAGKSQVNMCNHPEINNYCIKYISVSYNTLIREEDNLSIPVEKINNVCEICERRVCQT